MLLNEVRVQDLQKGLETKAIALELSTKESMILILMAKKEEVKVMELAAKVHSTFRVWILAKNLLRWG